MDEMEIHLLHFAFLFLKRVLILKGGESGNERFQVKEMNPLLAVPEDEPSPSEFFLRDGKIRYHFSVVGNGESKVKFGS